MREAYFEVGEEVILKSENHPECNGDALVIERNPGTYIDDVSGCRESTWGYKLSIESPTGNRWNQSALRKKHKPSEFTFEQLIRQEVEA